MKVCIDVQYIYEQKIEEKCSLMLFTNENKVIEKMGENADYPRTEDDLKTFADILMAKQLHKKENRN